MAKTPDHPPASRRQFIQGAVAGAGTLAFMNSKAQAAPPPQKWDSEVDVLIAGAGVSGCFAAIAAHDAGAQGSVEDELLAELRQAQACRV
jgi:NADPH-dependent 2,4-dienoyl-CoA reductase/sulfur reductase-like enzyme